MVEQLPGLQGAHLFVMHPMHAAAAAAAAASQRAPPSAVSPLGVQAVHYTINCTPLQLVGDEEGVRWMLGM